MGGFLETQRVTFGRLVNCPIGWWYSWLAGVGSLFSLLPEFVDSRFQHAGWPWPRRTIREVIPRRLTSLPPAVDVVVLVVPSNTVTLAYNCLQPPSARHLENELRFCGAIHLTLGQELRYRLHRRPWNWNFDGNHLEWRPLPRWIRVYVEGLENGSIVNSISKPAQKS